MVGALLSEESTPGFVKTKSLGLSPANRLRVLQTETKSQSAVPSAAMFFFCFASFQLLSGHNTDVHKINHQNNC